MTISEQQLIIALNQQLEQIFADLRSGAAQLSLPESTANLPDLDRYLLMVNTFYYQTFHDKYFLQYRQTLQQEVSRLLNLSHDEYSLKQDILGNIQRYARLYNQVKTIHGLLTITRQDSQLKILEITRTSTQQVIDLQYVLKTLSDRLQVFSRLLKTIEEFTSDEQLTGLARLYPEHFTLLERVMRLDLNKPSVTQGLDQVIGHLHHNRAQLRLLAGQTGDHASAQATIKNMVASTESVLTRQAPQELKVFYDQHLKNQFLLYARLMEADLEQMRYERVRQMARQFEAWMDRLVIVLDRGLRFANRHGTELLHSAYHLTSLPQKDLQSVQKDTQTVSDEVSNLVNDLASSQEPDSMYFLERAVSVIASSLNRLQAYTGTPLQVLPPLALHMERIMLELSFLQARLEILKEKQLYSKQVLEQYLSMHSMVQSYLDLLSNIKADLERLLAPRNISRLWKDHQVRVERIPLEKGASFPPDHISLLPHPQVQIVSGGLDSSCILHEEGDLFIIRVGQVTEYEIPRLILGRRD